jgi:hypothetical protein
VTSSSAQDRSAGCPPRSTAGRNIGDTETHVVFVELKVGSHEPLPAEHAELPEVELGPLGV